jgi:regulator of cell morphogenesis and NO signaling
MNRVWLEIPMTELCDHIERTHHAYLKHELPQLQALLHDLCERSGTLHLQLAQVGRFFGQLRESLERHMDEEEQVLFPLCRQLEMELAGDSSVRSSIFDRLRTEFREHEVAQNLVLRIRVLTDHYTVPSGADSTLKACYQRLRCLEVDLANHIHKENGILYRNASRAQRTAAMR